MNKLQNTKSILAKLLASENITISHQSVQTAYFDLQSRTLVCPVWQDMDGDLYDLLMGHEVGHALNTPTQGWHNALRDENGNPVPKGFKDFLNVLEDARIEKKIKRKYPGLSKSFANAYKSLHVKNFFGVRDIDVNTLNFIDRINVYFKMGAHMHVPWRNDWERDIVREVDDLETWEQVVELAKRIFEYVKEEEEPQIKNEQDLQDMRDQQRQQMKQQMQNDFGDDVEQQDDEDEDGDSGSYDSDEDYDDEDGDGSDGDGDSSDDDSEEENDSADGGLGDGETGDAESSDEEDSPVSKYGRQEYTNPINNNSEEQTKKVDSADDPESITDRAFRRREQELINESGHVFMLNLPEANLKNIIMPNSIVMRDLEKFYHQQLNDEYLNSIYRRKGVTYDALATKCVKKFNVRNKKYIMHIFKEFDMRKRATDYARTSIARTGELNMNVLHKYKFSNDLFKKISVVQKGKSHGLIMYVDMSGSMHNILKNTIEQTLVLVSFCKLANIPFDVYGFTNDSYSSDFLKTRGYHSCFTYDPKTEFNIDSAGFHLKHLIGSSLSSVAYRRSFNNLAILVNEYSGDRHGYDADTGGFQYDWTEGGFGLNGTPYVQTLLASREMIKNFRVDNKLDIVNVLYLTDGEGNTALSYPESVAQISWDAHKRAVFYYVDKKTQRKIRKEKYESEQSAVTRLVKDVTGCKHLGFYLVGKREMKDQLYHLNRDAEFGNNGYTVADVDKMRKCAKENNFFAASSIGYDKYFYIGSSNTNITDEELVITQDMTKHKMARTFSKTLTSKKSNRILVSQFAEELAVGL